MIDRVSRRLSVGVLAAALLAAAACKPAERADSDDSAAGTDTASAMAEQDSASAAAAAAATTSGATSSAPPTAASLTVDDIDRWKRGMEAELAAVREAGTKLAAAKTGNDTLTAMTGTLETSTREAGAKAAGVDPERYNFIRSTLSPLTAYLAPLEMEMNVKDMPPAMVAQMKQSREQSLAQASAGVPPAVIDALRPRAAELRKQDLTLVGERLKAAGAAR
jgi:hypothetical protein